MYTTAERVAMTIIYSREDQCLLRKVFDQRYPERNVWHVYNRQLEAKFPQFGTATNIKGDQPRLFYEATQIGVLG